MERQIETIKATGHKYGDWVVSKEPTGFEKGSKYRVCKNCNGKDTASIPKLELYPIVEEGDGYKITITREWYKKAWVYAAHIEFTDYSRFGTSCANGKYKNGYETTSHAHNRLNAILTVNGCYSAPYLDYTVVRSGKIWNGADRNLYIPGVYSSYTGLFQSGWEGKQGTHGITGVKVQQLVDDKLVTDTFCFGPPGLVNGELIGKNEGARAQRTFMGTNGNAGDIWLVVSDGRYNDGESAGLTFYEGMEYLKTKGCTFGIHLDGGGSTTMVYRGHVLNAVKEERAVVDFVYFR
jgi:exopolysaccharide biosynthesis protein